MAPRVIELGRLRELTLKGSLSFPTSLPRKCTSTRMENWRKRRLRDTKLPFIKPLEIFKFEVSSHLDTRLIKELAGERYINNARNFIFLGRSGTVKTHLATALGMEASSQGVRTKFVTGCGLANELIEARDEKTLARVIKRYAGYGLLIVGELVYVPFSKVRCRSYVLGPCGTA